MEKLWPKKETATAANTRASQIVTIADLKAFKNELLHELFTLLTSAGGIQSQKKWLKSHEVRKLLKISPGTLQSLKSSGIIPYTKIGGVHLFDADDINKLLESAKTNPLT